MPTIGSNIPNESGVSSSLNENGADLRRRLIAIYAVLIGGNVLVWIWAFAALGDRLLGTALLAYTFGLRHAVDADHIAAIDNVTRKLMQQGQRPVGVGLFFSLGQSSIVVLMSAGVAFAASALTSRFDSMKAVGGVIGTSVSALFLFAIALFNIIVLISIYRTAASPLSRTISTCCATSGASSRGCFVPCSCL